MIRTWSDHEIATDPVCSQSLIFTHFVWKNTTFCTPAIYQSPNVALVTKSDTPTSWNSARAIKSQTPASPDVKNETLQRHQMLRLPRNVTLQHHQMLRLPRKMTVHHHAKFWLTRNMTVMIDLRHTWSVFCNVTKLCAWYETCHSKIQRKLGENGKSIIYNGGRFERDPRMIRAWTGHLARAHSPRFFSRIGDALCMVKYNVLCSGYAPKFPHVAPAAKSGPCHEKWRSNISEYIAPATKSDIPKSPNVAPAMKSDIPKSPCKCCACHEKWHSDITKGCACHERWHTNQKLMLVMWVMCDVRCEWCVRDVSDVRCEWCEPCVMREVSGWWCVRNASDVRCNGVEILVAWKFLNKTFFDYSIFVHHRHYCKHFFLHFTSWVKTPGCSVWISSCILIGWECFIPIFRSFGDLPMSLWRRG